MGLYCGIDLHAKSSYLAIIDEQRKRVFNRNVTNDRETILSFLAPYRAELVRIVVESTFNWYWLMDDTLMGNDYTIHLANPCAIKQYKGRASSTSTIRPSGSPNSYSWVSSRRATSTRDRSDEQRAGERKRQHKEREPVPCLGFFGSCRTRPQVRYSKQELQLHQFFQ
jgi:hypothetical protein